mgnify:CR=1 FL=1
MKIKAFFLALLFALLLLPAAGGAAGLADEEMELGGIRLGDTREEVEAVYGEGADDRNAKRHPSGQHA